MWTVCYVDEIGNDKWERFLHREDVINFLNDYPEYADEDMLIFGPLADEYTYTPEQLLG